MPDSFIAQLVNAVLPLVELLVVTIVGVLAQKAIALIAAKVQNERIRNALNTIVETSSTVVLALHQTVVAELKASSLESSDGGSKFTEAEKIRIKAIAVAKVRELVGPKQIEQLRKSAGLDDDSIKTLIATQVESAVARLKIGII